MSGGRGRIGPGMISPFIKFMLIGNIAFFVLQQFMPEMTRVLGLVPAQFISDFPNRMYQPITYMFLHGGFGHLFFNMFVLWMFGTEIEFIWSSKVFGRFYLLAGLSGAILTLIVYPSQAILTIGASAAIYAVLIAYWMLFPNRMLYIYFLFPVKVKWAIPGMMLIGFLFSGGNVAHMAHLGGIVYAFAYLKTDLRFFSLKSKIKNLRHQRQEVKLEKNRHQAEEIMKKVDAILDKINAEGIENLSKEERDFLEQASKDLSNENQKK